MKIRRLLMVAGFVSLSMPVANVFADTIGNETLSIKNTSQTFQTQFVTSNRTYIQSVLDNMLNQTNNVLTLNALDSSGNTINIDSNQLKTMLDGIIKDTNGTVQYKRADTILSTASELGVSNASGSSIQTVGYESFDLNGNGSHVEILAPLSDKATDGDAYETYVASGTLLGDDSLSFQIKGFENTPVSVPIVKPNNSGEINVNGVSMYQVPMIVYQGTTYMPIWYIMQTLTQMNVKNTWDGSDLNFSSIDAQPQSANADGYSQISINGVPVEFCNSIVYQNTTYMPIQYVMYALQEMSIKTTWDGNTLNIG